MSDPDEKKAPPPLPRLLSPLWEIIGRFIGAVEVAMIATSDDIAEIIGYRFRADPALNPLCDAAAAEGNIEVVRWAVARTPEEWSETTMACAAGKGHFDILKLLRPERKWDESKSRWIEQLQCPIDESAFTAAASGGHLEILEWLAFRGIYTNEEVAISSAALNGHIKVVAWLLNPPYDPNGQIAATVTNDTYAAAAEGGHNNVIQLLVSCEIEHPMEGDEEPNTSAMENAAAHGHLSTAQMLREYGFPWGEDVSAAAAREGHQGVLEWLHEGGCPWDVAAAAGAAENGHFGVLKWLHTHGCPWDEEASVGAASSGNHEMLHWARAEGCPWDASDCAIAAASRGDLETLAWILQSSQLTPDDDKRSSIFPAAAEGGNLEMLKFLYARGYRPCKTSMNRAVRHDHLECARWLHEQKCPWDENACGIAARVKNVAMLAWLRSEGCTWNEDECREGLNGISFIDPAPAAVIEAELSSAVVDAVVATFRQEISIIRPELRAALRVSYDIYRRVVGPEEPYIWPMP